MENNNCVTPGCVNLAKQGKYCYTCANKRWQKANPEKHIFNTLKNNAKRRGKVFELTFDDFMEFCVDTDYLAQKGIFKHSLHIYRKIEWLGYTKNNIQALENTKNIKKHLAYKGRDQHGNAEFTVVKNNN